MKNIRICRILFITLVALASRVMAEDPFQVSVLLESPGIALAQTEPQLLSVQVVIPSHHKLYSDQFRVEVPAPSRLIPRSLPKPEKRADPVSGEESLVFTHSFKAIYAIENLNTNRLPVTVRWQGCNEAVCFLPVTKIFLISWADGKSSSDTVDNANTAALETTMPADWHALTNRFVLVAQQAGYLGSSEFISFLESAKGQGNAAPETPLDRWLKRSLWLSILVVLMGGMALNLTPCVLPMIPINLAIIGAGAMARSRRRGAGLGALYGLGMVAAYGVLGLLVVLTGSKFGAINASPWFNFSVALLFAVLALAMFDVYAIDFSRFQSRFSTPNMGDGHHRWGGTLLIVVLGALAAILSGACVAPVVLSVLLLSASLYAQGHGAALMLPFILGLGMALPWPLAGAGMAWLPKPGHWMERIKYGFGILILIAAVYYAYTGLTIWRSPRQQPLSDAQGGWLTSLPEALAQADREQKPLFIDFWASWCKNCHAMEATTFRNARVRQQLESFVRVKIQAEHPNQPPDRDILDAFGVIGLPTYVILKPDR
ncbi:MAG: thioredoxin family protein [Kiritimatiellae bacterium]|nr:thioredoxin family protein [Kiritimatiellia bacterium]